MKYATGLALLVASATYLAPSVASADTKCNLDIRRGFRELIPSSPLGHKWVEAKASPGATSGQREIAKDGVVLQVEFTQRAEADVFSVPTSFAFHNGFPLLPKIDFEQGRVHVKAKYELPSGEVYYAVAAPGRPDLTVFVRLDGQLCNKVLRYKTGDYVFLIKEYTSSPTTRLELATVSGNATPVVLKVVYLGASGGIAGFREIWSRDGRVIATEDQQYDMGAKDLSVAGMTVPISKMTSQAVTVGAIPAGGEIKWNQEWSRRFGK